MSPLIILAIFLVYTGLIFFVARLTLRKANNESYFLGNRNSPWFVVAYGMIGASLSGVTFMSVPGLVKAEQFSYLMLVFGFFSGYLVIAYVLLPLYYKLNLTSIYTYLEKRFGMVSYKTGSFFFIISRLIGSSFRLFLVVSVLQMFVFDAWGVPMVFTIVLFVSVILLYSFQGGIRTIVWTDTLQTTFMLTAVITTIVIVAGQLNMDLQQLYSTIKSEGFTRMIVTDVDDPRFFLKQFFAGMFITIVMTGLDQDMMQKNLSCRSLSDARKNVLTFGAILIPVNLLFLFLGAVLWIYADLHGITMLHTSDELFPTLALQHLGLAAGLTFFFGLIAAAYSSADGTLTALTTAFCIDFLGLKRNANVSEARVKKIRYRVHIGFAIIMMLVIMGYSAVHNKALLSMLFTVAGYTYGPLLGLFAFGLFTKRAVRDRWVPVVAILAPAISFLLSHYSQQLFWGYRFGFEILIVNGLLTFFGLLLLSKPKA
jgi:Na+/proline symporter